MSKNTAWNTPGMVVRMGGTEYVTLATVAQMLGVEHGSAQMYHRRATRNRREGTPKVGDMPEPDARFGVTPVWERKTIEAWMLRRPGRGVGGGKPSHRVK